MTVQLDKSRRGNRHSLGLVSVVGLVGALAYAGTACDGPADSLLGASSGSGQGWASGEGGPGPGTDAGDGIPTQPGEALALAQKLFIDALPELKATCGTQACHGGPN